MGTFGAEKSHDHSRVDKNNVKKVKITCQDVGGKKDVESQYNVSGEWG